MRIVFLGDSLVFQKAGIMRYNTMLLRTLMEYPKLKELILITPQDNPDFTDVFQKIIPASKANYLQQKLRYFTQIPTYVNGIKPDLVIEPAHFGPFRVGKGIRRSTVIHDLTPLSHPHLHPRVSSVVQRLTMRSIIKRSDLIITNSEATKHDVEQFETSVKSVLPLYPPLERVSNNVNTDANDNIYILSIGTREPRKDYVTLLKAFESVYASDNRLRLVILGGEGWRNDGFDNALVDFRYSEYVTILGYVSDQEKQMWLAKASMLVSTSLAEGLGLPLLEAVQYNLPVICSNIPSYVEIGKAHFTFFEQQNSEALSSVIKQQIDKQRKVTYDKLYTEWQDKREHQVEQLFHQFDIWNS